MKTDRELLRMALDALESAQSGLHWHQDMVPQYADGSDDEINAQIESVLVGIREALARPEQEPVEAWHEDRKVTVYETTVLRSWGPNIESQQDFPRTAQQVQDSFSWLYALQPAEREPVAAPDIRCEEDYISMAPSSWDDDHRRDWARLQAAEHNRMQWRNIALASQAKQEGAA